MIKHAKQHTENSPPTHPSPSRGEGKGGGESRYAGFRPLNSEKGIALVMVIVLSAISLAIMAALIYMITSETQISGIQKRYKTAREAGIGGSEVAYQLVALRGQTADQNAFINSLNTLGLGAIIRTLDTGTCTRSAIAACSTYPASYTGMAAKLNLPTSCWTGCDNSLTITPVTTSSYDMQFDLGTTTTYRVYAKIVDTVEGNSGGGDEGLIKGGVVSANSGEVQVQSKPYLYTIEVLTENPSNPEERAKFSILYQY